MLRQAEEVDKHSHNVLCHFLMACQGETPRPNRRKPVEDGDSEQGRPTWPHSDLETL